MKWLVCCSQKGGVAKTTTVITLAHGLALRGYRTLVVDLDSQGHCASALGVQHEPGVFNLLVGELPVSDVIRTTGRPRLSLLPGDKRTRSAEIVLVAEGRLTPDLLANVLHPLTRKGLDFCVMDTAPAVGGLQEAGMYAADLAIIPCATDFLSAEAVAATLATLQTVNGKGGRCELLGILPTFHDDRTKESAAILADLQETFGADAVLPAIHRATVIREATAAGQTVFEFAPSSRAAEEYANLVWRVLDYAKTKAG